MKAVYRRVAVTPRKTRNLVFDRLPHAVKERLTRGIVHGSPEPLLAAPSGGAQLARRVATACAFLAIPGTLGLGMWGFGNLDSGFAVQPASFAPLYGVLVAVAAVSVAALVLLRAYLRGAPFRSGRYLFALDLVEASGGVLRVTSLDTLHEIGANGRGVALIFEDGHEVLFPVRKGEDAAELARKADRAVHRARELAYPEDQKQIEGLDPFHVVRISDDWETAAHAGKRRRPQIIALAAAALCAAPAGLGLLRARNALSDDVMFDEAKAPRPGEDVTRKLAAYAAKGHRHAAEVGPAFLDACKGDSAELERYLRMGGSLGGVADAALFELAKTDPEALRRYLKRGGARSAEADDMLFERARAEDTLDACNAYLELGRRHAQEVRKELLPAADFAQAERRGLAGAFFSFVRRNPGSKHEDEAWRRVRALYAKGRADAAAAELPPGGRRFREALLTSLEDRADVRVSVGVTMGPPSSVAEADAEFAAKFGRRYLRAADRFSPAALDSLAEQIWGRVAGEIARTFPGGVVEATHPAADEGRPRIDVLCKPVAYAAATWGAEGDSNAAPEVVTPIVGFLITVSGTVYGRDGEETQTGWKLSIQDDTDGKMQINVDGPQRPVASMLEDAFARFFEGVPERVAASFRARL